MNRRTFVTTSSIITTGIVLKPDLVIANPIAENPIVDFFIRLCKDIVVNVIVEGILEWIKKMLWGDEVKKSVIQHTENLISSGYIPGRIGMKDDYFFYETIKNNQRGNYSQKFPFFYPERSTNSIIDMHLGEFSHLTGISKHLNGNNILTGTELRESLMPVKILSRSDVSANRLKYLAYESKSENKVSFHSAGGNKGYFRLDGPSGLLKENYTIV